MSRRGSFVYYLTAWVIGCFVFCLPPWFRAMGAIGSGISRNLLLVYFITLIAGAPDTLIFAFLLRVILRVSLSSKKTAEAWWLWMIDGAILGFAMTYLLAWAEAASHGVPSFDHGALHIVYQFFLAAPHSLQESSPWIVATAGAVVGVVLFLVDRAFEPQDVSAENPRA